MLADPTIVPTAFAEFHPVLEMLEKRLPGSLWDLLHWGPDRLPRFLLRPQAKPNPQLLRLDESRQAPPILLEPSSGEVVQLRLAFPELPPPESPVDLVWPLGERPRAPWICGRLSRQQAETLAERRAWLGLIFSEFVEARASGDGVSAGDIAGGAAKGRQCLSILHHADSPIANLLVQLERVARTETPVFLQGESGVGKELFARALHHFSARSGGNFVAQNGGALTDTLIESELFGHTRGSFTGAREERVGLFELASSGSFFLDEVGDLSPMLQVRLLRVLQDRQIRRVGDNRLRDVDFRLVTATHHDMEELVRSGRFRLDLWYRIQGVSLLIPPLRERQLDIPLLAEAFLRERSDRYAMAMREIGPDAMAVLQRYRWPGNVRELENEMGRVVAFYGELPRLERWMLSERLFGDRDDALPEHLLGLSLQDAQEDLERRMIRQTLNRHRGNRSRSARALGLSRQGLLKKLKRLGLERVALPS